MAFEATWKAVNQSVLIQISGELDASSARMFKEVVEVATASAPQRLVLDMKELRYLASAGLRILIFAKQKMGVAEVVIASARESVLRTLMLTGFHQSVVLVDEGSDSLARVG